MTQRDALESAADAMAEVLEKFTGGGFPRIGKALRVSMVKAALAALTPGDGAGLVKRAREMRRFGDAQPAFYPILDELADALEAKDATIARLQGEVERLGWGTVAACADEIETTANNIEKSCDGYVFELTAQRLRGMRDAVKMLRAAPSAPTGETE